MGYNIISSFSILVTFEQYTKTANSSETYKFDCLIACKSYSQVITLLLVSKTKNPTKLIVLDSKNLKMSTLEKDNEIL